MHPHDTLLIFGIIFVAAGMYCFGRLHGAAFIQKRTEIIFRKGYMLGLIHADKPVEPEHDHPMLRAAILEAESIHASMSDNG